MLSIISFFITALIVVLIIHFLIKHYLLYLPSSSDSSKKRVRFNLTPEVNNYQEEEQIRQETEDYLKPRNTRFLDTEEMEEMQEMEEMEEMAEMEEAAKCYKEGNNVKSELLQFVKDYDKKHSYQNAENSGGQEECDHDERDDDDLSQFFQINNNDKYAFTATPTCQNDEVLDELPAKLDNFSKDPAFSEETGSENVLSKDRWKYANEKVMNGGQKDGIQAYDNFNMTENFAVF